jgi:hypothetical protein
VRSLALIGSVLLASTPAPPAGTFRVTLTSHDLAAVGASQREAGWGSGTWTLSLAGKRWTLAQRGGRYGNAVDSGTVVGGKLVVHSVNGFVHNEDVGTVSWESTPPRLRFFSGNQPRNRDIVQILTARPWVRLR